MKVLQPTTATLLTLACLALGSVDAGGRGFKAPGGNNTNNATTSDAKFQKIKTAANFGKSGAKIDMCPSGDCTTGQMITLAMSRLEEIDANNQTVVKAENFNQADGDWGDFAETTLNNVSAMSTSYVATLSVKDKGSVAFSPAFNLTASIYSANGTAMNGNQSVAVPAGGLKFTVALSGWTFQNAANRLRFAITVKAKGKTKSSGSTTATATANTTADATTTTTNATTNATDLPQPEKKKKTGTESKIDRLDFGEGMFMDAPAIAVIDGTDTDITASVDVNGGNTEYVWVFPSFTETLYYDPVIGSSDVSAQVASDTSGSTTDTTTTNTTTATTTNTTNTTTPTPSTTTSGASSSSLSTAAGVLFSGLAVVAAYALR